MARSMQRRALLGPLVFSAFHVAVFLGSDCALADTLGKAAEAQQPFTEESEEDELKKLSETPENEDDPDGPVCQRDTGARCFTQQLGACDESRGALCVDHKCICQGDTCSVNGRCVTPAPTPAPTPEPTPATPEPTSTPTLKQVDLDDLEIDNDEESTAATAQGKVGGRTRKTKAKAYGRRRRKLKWTKSSKFGSRRRRRKLKTTKSGAFSFRRRRREKKSLAETEAEASDSFEEDEDSEDEDSKSLLEADSTFEDDEDEEEDAEDSEDHKEEDFQVDATGSVQRPTLQHPQRPGLMRREASAPAPPGKPAHASSPRKDTDAQTDHLLLGSIRVKTVPASSH